MGVPDERCRARDLRYAWATTGWGLPILNSIVRYATLCLLCASGARAAELGPLPAPLDLQIEAPGAVRDLLSQYVKLYPLAQRGDDTDRIALERNARRQVGELLATEGYFSPRVSVGPVTQTPLTLTVEPGPRARIAQVDIVFAGELAEPGEARAVRRDALRARWSLPVGAPFRQADWTRAKQQLLQDLVEVDYARAALADSRAAVDPEAATVALEVRYDSGAAITLGALVVSGLDDYDAHLVERYSTLREGEPYRQERLLALQTTLQNTPYFSSATVALDPDWPQAERVPVVVQVSESRPKRVAFGAGFSSNTGARGEASYRHHNFLDRAWLLSTGVRLEQRQQFAYADVALPPTEKAYHDSFGVLFEASDIQGLRTARSGVGVVRTRLRGQIETQLGVNFQREASQPEGAAEVKRDALVLNYSWTYRAVDNPLDPRSGYTLNLQAGGAARALLSDADFTRLYARLQTFWPIGRLDTLQLRAEGGIVYALDRDGVPEQFLFRAGGAQSVRGYAYRSLGVRQGAATLGGRRLVTASAEYTHWLNETWGVAAFYDIGTAGDSRDDFRLASGVGAGVRWRTAVGPLALDLAYGVEDRRVRPHLSVQIAF